jgi:hypothetical protein
MPRLVSVQETRTSAPAPSARTSSGPPRPWTTHNERAAPREATL